MLDVGLLKLLYAATNDDAGQLRYRANAFLDRKKKASKLLLRRQLHPTQFDLRQHNLSTVSAFERQYL